jgi:geranylgeranyl diphosphate synthase type I
LPELLAYPVRKARAQADRNPEWPVLRLPLLLSQALGCDPSIARGLALASLLLYGFADLTDDAQDGDLQGDWGWQRAVNAGNALLFLAHRTLLELPIAPERCNALTTALSQAGLAMTLGQECDLLARYPQVPTVETYMETVRGKSGASAAFFASAAAIATDQDPATRAALHAYGECLGSYLQILSDADAFAHPDSSDLRNRTVTLPLIVALQPGSPGHQELAERLEQGAPGTEIGRMVSESGGLMYAQLKARMLQRKAMVHLADLPLDTATRTALEGQFRVPSRSTAYAL